MTPHYSDDWLTLYGGDCREVLAALPSNSVDCVVTSPPYWGLRDYGTATWTGGQDGHSHIGSVARTAPPGSAKQASKRGSTDVFSGDCLCGAQRIDSQLGLERTPEEYVQNMVAVFREVRRVLKPSGTCWLNLGDSYAGSWGANGRGEGTNAPRPDLETKHGTNAPNRNPPGLKPKDLVGIPWRVAFALQADGWYLRSDIIWAKPNPMPESVTDRPTKSHEYLFLLTKSARYYFDADAVREPNGAWSEAALEGRWQRRTNASVRADGPMSRNGASQWETGNVANGADYGAMVNPAGRNIRSVWTIATRPYPGAHFAVFPPELPERCIKAGSSEKGVCPHTGEPWERVVERTSNVERGVARTPTGRADKPYGKVPGSDTRGVPSRQVETVGWKPTCDHDAEPAPAVVLDPFGGSGTVGMVANRLSRRAILIDLNPDYLEQQMKRNAQTPLGLGT